MVLGQVLNQQKQTYIGLYPMNLRIMVFVAVGDGVVLQQVGWYHTFNTPRVYECNGSPVAFVSLCGAVSGWQ